MSNVKKLILSALLITVANISQAQTQGIAPAPQAESTSFFSGPLYSSQFSGPYIGFKLGVNSSNASGVVNESTHNTVFPGFTAGYGIDIGQFLLGAEAFADMHNGSTTYKDGGLDARFGIPLSQFMPYARVGFTGSWPETRFHWGLGVEYKFNRNLSAVGEWTTDESNTSGTSRRNDSYTVGLHYYFK